MKKRIVSLVLAAGAVGVSTAGLAVALAPAANGATCAYSQGTDPTENSYLVADGTPAATTVYFADGGVGTPYAGAVGPAGQAEVTAAPSACVNGTGV